ncbi:hypothetical protein ACFYE9_36700 [Rhizobium leguminosarum]|uniref:Uncharacterized protein n=2 Tax=Rhizobium leguminosarum TaxID=384 RepID=A0A154IP97_RHILE|nr:hypothetical protein [Rhizobium leguminosarum]KZB01928.1 hypothetical protein A4A59_12995 [Rhizobium leguminosarum]
MAVIVTTSLVSVIVGVANNIEKMPDETVEKALLALTGQIRGAGVRPSENFPKDFDSDVGIDGSSTS